MEFDKKTIFAFILIGLILIFIQTDFYQKHFVPAPQKKNIEPPEKSLTSEPATISEEQGPKQSITPNDTSNPYKTLKGKGETVVIENNLYRAEFSTQGTSLRSWVLKKYFLTDKLTPIELVGDQDQGNLSLLIPTKNDTLDTSPLVFSVNKKQIQLNLQHPIDSLVFVLNLDDMREIRKTYVFYHNCYDIKLKVEFKNFDTVIDGYSYFVTWRTGLRWTEPDLDQDMSKAYAYAYQGDVEKYDAGSKFDPKDWDHPTDWVAIRTKYFTISVIPRDAKAQAVKFFSEKKNLGEKILWKKYKFDFQMPYESRASAINEFTVYMGPLDYDLLKSYNANLEDMMDWGWRIFRPFGKFILWCFIGLHNLVPNYGFVIIIFSILIKIVLYPLTKKSYQSMKEMQALQPSMQEINEKYKNDPQKKQQEIMSLYKEHGINPLGGCMPMLLQMPLLIALFQVFQSTIQLRQAEFIWWINDLSRPDTIATLPLTLPLYGNTLNILPIFMGVTMFIQQKMSMKDPKQKALVYIMPIFFTLLFNSFPSGLNLYYALFNVLSIAQEKLIPYRPKTPAELKEKKTQKRRIKYDYRGRYYK